MSLTTTSAARPRNDKRTRLVEAADQLFHQQGVSNTTLANIAQLADVPLGNVYYYFKSKESIVLAVIEYRRRLIQKDFEELNAIPNSLERLTSLIKKAVERKENTATYGDNLGSLCQELGRQGGKIAESSANLMREVLAWCESQFNSLGKGESSKKLAYNLVSRLQGLSLLTLTFRDPAFMDEQSNYLIDWVETI